MGIVAAAKALWDAFALRACSITTAWLLSLIFALMAVPHFDAIAEAKPDRTYRVEFMLEVRVRTNSVCCLVRRTHARAWI